MRVDELRWSAVAGWQPVVSDREAAQLVIYFGTRQALGCGARFEELREMFPHSHLVGCTTGGHILADDVGDDLVVASVLRFGSTALRVVSERIDAPEDSRRCGESIGRQLAAEDLAGLFILSDGLNVNGSELVAGIVNIVGSERPITGGLAGDGAAFQTTLVGADCPPQSRLIAAVGFYGTAVHIGHGSAGGWDVFGPRRLVTRSVGNVLYQLDDEPALDLYERYLGEEEARGLPGTGLLFPLQITDPSRNGHQVVRTILAVDRDARSMTFAGDVPQGWSAQLMRGHFDRLTAGAAEAARQAGSGIPAEAGGDKVAILVSCIGRRLLMGQRVVDEVEAAGAALGSGTVRIGFYSYGEISPHAASGMCELHNQTMTVTTIAEAVG